MSLIAAAGQRVGGLPARRDGPDHLLRLEAAVRAAGARGTEGPAADPQEPSADDPGEGGGTDRRPGPRPTASSSASTARYWTSSSSPSCASGSTTASRRCRPTWTPGSSTTTTSGRISATATRVQGPGRRSSDLSRKKLKWAHERPDGAFTHEAQRGDESGYRGPCQARRGRLRPVT